MPMPHAPAHPPTPPYVDGDLLHARELMLASLVQAAVDLGNLLHPSPPLWMFQLQDIIQRPVKVIRNVGYLLMQAFERVAYNTPPRRARSTSSSLLQCGQAIVRVVLPVSLIWR